MECDTLIRCVDIIFKESHPRYFIMFSLVNREAIQVFLRNFCLKSEKSFDIWIKKIQLRLRFLPSGSDKRKFELR